MNTSNLNSQNLMVGDWVTLSKGNWSENRQVELIDIEMIAEAVYVAEPIPITPEILEKNGFEKLNERRFLLEDLENNYWVKFYPKDTNYTRGAYDYININCGCITIREMPIEFIHELQHALRLCGIDKEIEL